MDVPVKLQSTGLYLIKILQEDIVSSILAIIESMRMTLILTVEQLVNSLSIKISIDHPNRKYTAFKFMYIIYNFTLTFNFNTICTYVIKINISVVVFAKNYSKVP